MEKKVGRHQIILSQAGKEDLALALYLWKDFKCQGKIDAESIRIVKQAYALAEFLGIKPQLDELYSKMPPFDKIFRKIE